MQVVVDAMGFSLYLSSGRLLARHTQDKPFVRIGMEIELHDTYHYPEKDFEVQEHFDLGYYKVQQSDQAWAIYLSNDPNFHDALCLSYEASSPHRIKLESSFPRKYFNRYWFHFFSSKDEFFYGGGERCQHFNIKHDLHALYLHDSLLTEGVRTMPLRLVRMPAFISSSGYAMILSQGEPVMLNALQDDQYLLETWGYPHEIIWIQSSHLIELVQEQSNYIGRNTLMPSWPLQRVIAGFKGPMRRIQSNMSYFCTLGFDLGGLWLQDWSRLTFPSFGESFEWNWHCPSNFKDPLKAKVHSMQEHGINTIAYMNGFLVEGSLPFNEADRKEYLITTRNNDLYLYAWQEFNLAIIDLYNPEAFTWFVQVIKDQLLDLGIRSWIIDDGSHLPLDGILYDGSLSYYQIQHWPELLAKASHRAIQEAGLEGEVFLLATSAWLQSMRYVHALVLAKEFIQIGSSWSLKPTFTALLSGSMSGCGIQVSIIGNSVGLPASEELIIRHAEIVAFTACFWVQEADRRYQGLHYYKERSIMQSLLHLATLYEELAPYREILLEELAQKGLPLNRALFLHDEHDEILKGIEDQMLLGSDVMIAPIFHDSQRSRRIYIPRGSWHHFSSNLVVQGPQWLDLKAPLGEPLAFYRADSIYYSLFQRVGHHFCSLIELT